MSNFHSLIERLATAGVDFVIVGGYAGVVHGCTYVTQDIDICCEFSAANLLKLQNAISDLNPVHRMTPKRKKLGLTEEECKHYNNLYLDTDIGQLDCLSFIDGIGDYQKVKKSSELVKIKKLKLNVLTIDALIKAKKTVIRPRDKEIILQLEAIKKLNKRSF